MSYMTLSASLHVEIAYITQLYQSKTGVIRTFGAKRQFFKYLLNPRTDGGLGHLSTDGVRGITAHLEISKTKQARDKR